MIRGTTPTLEFSLPFETSLLDEAFVTFSQKGKVVLDKQLSECSVEKNTLTVKLTQEDTLKLLHDCLVQIQIRARTEDGSAVASNIIDVFVNKILKDGVI